jgi:predicted small metal-binding protein
VKRNLTCPCGEHITGTDEDDLVEKVQQHLKDKHPSHDYSRDEILFMAY